MWAIENTMKEKQWLFQDFPFLPVVLGRSMGRDVSMCELGQGGFDLARLSFIDDVSKDRLMDQFKARIIYLSRSRVVYKFSCAGCSACYVCR